MDREKHTLQRKKLLSKMDKNEQNRTKIYYKFSVESLTQERSISIMNVSCKNKLPSFKSQEEEQGLLNL